MSTGCFGHLRSAQRWCHRFGIALSNRYIDTWTLCSIPLDKYVNGGINLNRFTFEGPCQSHFCSLANSNVWQQPLPLLKLKSEHDVARVPHRLFDTLNLSRHWTPSKKAIGLVALFSLARKEHLQHIATQFYCSLISNHVVLTCCRSVSHCYIALPLNHQRLNSPSRHVLHILHVVQFQQLRPLCLCLQQLGVLTCTIGSK